MLQRLTAAIGRMWNSGRNGKIAVGIGAFVVVCFACTAVGSILGSGGQRRQAAQPTSAPAAAAAAEPTSAPAPAEPTAAPASGGLGLTREQWESTRGSGTPDPVLGTNYAGGYVVAYQADTAGVDTAGYIEQRWEAAAAPSLEDARAASKAIIPADSQLVKTYDAGGRTVDLYISPWLKDRFPASVKIKNADFPTWVNGDPGNFIVLYRITEGKVTSIVLGLGNNP